MSDDTLPSKSPYKLEIPELGKVLEGQSTVIHLVHSSEFLKAGLPPPDFIIIHHIDGTKMPYPYTPVEFHGFPPWQINLAEFQCVWPAYSSARS